MLQEIIFFTRYVALLSLPHNLPAQAHSMLMTFIVKFFL